MHSTKGHALVTGGAGLIGSHLADLLVEKGYEVTILDNLEPQTHPRGKPVWVNPHAHFVQGDIRDTAVLSRALEGVRFVFHLAAFGGFTTEISKYVDVNVSGTSRIFERLAAGKFSVEKIVVASSQALYAEGIYECRKDGQVLPPPRPLGQLRRKQWEVRCPHCGGVLKSALTSEEKPGAGETPYALSKELEERLALVVGKQRGVPVVALRFGVTYGPRQSIFNPYTGIVSIFSTQILNDLAPLVYEDGAQTRDFIYVGDVARANLFVMENEKADFQVFNVGTGKATSVAALARMLSATFGKSIEPKIPGEFRLGDVRHIILNPAKLERLGFRRTTDLKKGLPLFAEWMRSQGPVEEHFTQAHAHLKRNRIVYD